jgi:HlyD family secretion protein
MKIVKLVSKKKIIVLVCAVILAATVLYAYKTGARQSVGYQFVTLTTGSVRSTVSSTGTLSPVVQVEVGTQVSGTIKAVYADFNDHVTKGEVIALLDSSLLRVAVNEAQSGLLKSEAQLEESESAYQRGVKLFEKKLIAESDYQPLRTAYLTAQASMTSARAALERAEQNLRYAIIRAPINGTVTERNVEAGQTVAASFSTPTLFIIAQDLSKMEIKALVDESDIGRIAVGQNVEFTVQAFSGKTFTGSVRQIRVQPSTSSNVVNYTVIISADNPGKVLLPGMTATVDFITESRTDVLLVPNSALRFQPAADEIARAFAAAPKGPPPPGDSLGHPRPAPGLGNSVQESDSDRKALWYLDSDGNLKMEPVRAGISDGTNTQIIGARTLAAGRTVISGSESASSKSTTTKSSLKMQGGPPGGMPPPM